MQTWAIPMTSLEIKTRRLKYVQITKKIMFKELKGGREDK